MKKKLLLLSLASFIIVAVSAQVTRLSNNTSYDWGFALTNTKIILRSQISKTIWVYDIPGNSFTQLSAAVTVEQDYDFGVMGGKLYFAGKTVLDGIELWVTDGTPGGTSLVKNINPGAADSEPKYGFVAYNSYIYFTANDGTTGRELWKSDGTGPNTLPVKNINPGAADAFSATLTSDFKVIGGVLVFSAATAADGDELWKTDGSDPGTTQLKNIYTTATYGSHMSSFTEYGTNLIFTAFDEVNGQGIWKTDGTPSGTILIADIDPTPPLPPPFYYLFTSVLPFFFNFQNELYFSGSDGSNGFELWKTDGTTTVLVKDINPGVDDGFPQVFTAVKKGSKFFFSAMRAAEGTELWESDGSGPGTVLFKDVATGPTSSDAFIIPNFFGNGLFQGNKFFFVANTPGVEGNEYYVSDGTPAGTVILQDINPGPASGADGINFSIFYTDTKFFFLADNGINGSEIWQTDGTPGGASMLADVNILPTPAEGSAVTFATLASGTIFFFATDGDDAVQTDFFKIDGTFTMPLRWISVEARPNNNDIVLLWKTAEEEQTDHFIVQRSADGTSYQDIGRVNANGGLTNNYTFTDAGAMLKTGIKKWFYRIKYVDKDAKSALSRVVTIALNKTIAQIRILPNPAGNELKLVIDAVKNSSAVIRVVNMEGKTVLQRSVNVTRGENVITNDISHLPDGVYLLHTVADGSTTVERFLIQR